MTPEKERFNGWAAMLGFVAAVGAYATTGQIIPEHLLMEKQKVIAEKWNGRLAMLGLVATTSDILTGHMFFGMF